MLRIVSSEMDDKVSVYISMPKSFSLLNLKFLQVWTDIFGQLVKKLLLADDVALVLHLKSSLQQIMFLCKHHSILWCVIVNDILCWHALSVSIDLTKLEVVQDSAYLGIVVIIVK